MPSAFESARSLLPRHSYGTIVADPGYVHRLENLAFLPGAMSAVKLVNDRGNYAFLVPNQAGVARGLFSEAEVQIFNSELQRRLRAVGAHFDDVRYCPYHPDSTIGRYRRSSDWRKTSPRHVKIYSARGPSSARPVSWWATAKAISALLKLPDCADTSIVHAMLTISRGESIGTSTVRESSGSGRAACEVLVSSMKMNFFGSRDQAAAARVSTLYVPRSRLFLNLMA